MRRAVRCGTPADKSEGPQAEGAASIVQQGGSPGACVPAIAADCRPRRGRGAPPGAAGE